MITIQFSTARPPEHFWQIDFSKWICRLTHSPFSHVDYVMADGNLLGSSNSPKAPVIAGNPSGVAIRPPDYHHFRVRRRAVLNADEEQVSDFEHYLRDQLGEPFDSSAVSPRFFLSPKFADRDWRVDNCWFCAELMAHAVEVAGLLPWPIIAVKNRITASDLLLIINPIMTNVEDFWEPVAGLVKGPYEIA